MKPAMEVLIIDKVNESQRLLSVARKDNLLLVAFEAWLSPNRTAPTEIVTAQKALSAQTGAKKTYKDAGSAGYLAGLSPIKESDKKLLISLLDWVAQRSPFVADGVPTGLCIDGVALLGIAVGCALANDPPLQEKSRKWAESFADEALKSPGLTGAQRDMFIAALKILAPDKQLGDENFKSPIARIALLSKGVGERPSCKDLEAAEIQALEQIRNQPQSQDGFEAALKIAAYDSIRQTPIISTARPTPIMVADVLSRLPMSFQRWTWETGGKDSVLKQQWDIKNEYHVQNLLWFLLAPLFPDLREEEYLKSIGQLQPRADLDIPSLQLVIEAKFMYADDKPQKLIEELAADASLYLRQGTGVLSLIPVIWDDGARSEDHAVLKRGVDEIKGVVRTIVISRPGVLGPGRQRAKRERK